MTATRSEECWRKDRALPDCPLAEECARLRLIASKYRDLELKCAAQAVEIAGLRMEVERGREALGRAADRLMQQIDKTVGLAEQLNVARP